jgi:hypothetical protein
MKLAMLIMYEVLLCCTLLEPLAGAISFRYTGGDWGLLRKIMSWARTDVICDATRK